MSVRVLYKLRGYSFSGIKRYSIKKDGEEEEIGYKENSREKDV